MNFRQLECFFAVAEQLHFGRAASELHLSQSTVSEAIRALERHLGAPVFRRTTRRATLTPFGEDFLSQVKPHWDGLRTAYNLARLSHRGDDELVLGHTPELGHLVLPELIGSCAPGSEPERPELWRPMAMHTHDQLEKVGNGGIDIGLCWMPTVRPPLVSARLTRCPFIVIMHQDDELADRPQLALSEMRGRRIVVSSRQVNLFIDARLQAALLQSGLSLSSLDEVSGYEEVALRVAARGHVGIHPASIAAVNRVPGVLFRPLAEPGLTLDVCAVHRQEDTARLASFVGILRSVTTLAINTALGQLAATA